MMAKEYTYAAIGGKYFCLQSSILALTWVLLVQYRALRLGSLGIQRRQIPHILKSLVKFRLIGPPNPSDTITLPVFGHLIIKVHRGYKAFDFLKLNATKLFDHEVSAADAHKEIEAVTEASSLDFAPTILGLSRESRWYTETLVPGKRSLKTEKLNPVIAYENIVVNYLRQMILSRPLRTEDLGTCAPKLQYLLTTQLTHSHLPGELSDKVRSLVESISSQLKAAADIPVFFAWTHGDFSFVNFIYPENRILVIDWEDAGERSLLHDLFNYFFTEIYYERAPNNLVTEIDDAILLLFERIDMEGISDSFDAADTIAAYRWIYYLERVSTLLARDASDIRSRVIRRTIDIFVEHESAKDKHNTSTTVD